MGVVCIGVEESEHRFSGGNTDTSQVVSLINVEALVLDPTDGKPTVPQSTPLIDKKEND